MARPKASPLPERSAALREWYARWMEIYAAAPYSADGRKIRQMLQDTRRMSLLEQEAYIRR